MTYYTSLSGLKAAQTDLSTISNNIANVGSVGFKQSRTDFGDLIASSAFQAQGSVVGQGTALRSITQEFTQGSFQTTDRSLDLAVSGEGFFVTRGELSGADVSYTRNGAFSLDSKDYVTDSTGGYLQVLPVDSLGNVTATGATAMQNLQLQPTVGAPKATSEIDLTLSMPSSADIPSNRTAYAGGTYKFDPNDANSYNQVSSTTIYDTTGKAIPATIYYVRTSTPTSSDPTSGWDAHLMVGDTEVSSDASAATQPAPLHLTFAADGTLTSPSSATTFAPVTPTGASAPLTLTLALGSATKEADSSFTVAAQSQNGSTVGKLSNVTVDNKGLVTASYSDGTNKLLGKVALATFANPSGLSQLGNAKWGQSGNSGEAAIDAPATGVLGNIQSGALEQSNVDLTGELVALIAAQRNFQANAKALDTNSQIISTIVNMQG